MDELKLLIYETTDSMSSIDRNTTYICLMNHNNYITFDVSIENDTCLSLLWILLYHCSINGYMCKMLIPICFVDLCVCVSFVYVF